MYGLEDCIKRIIRLRIRSFFGKMRKIDVDIDICATVDQLKQLIIKSSQLYSDNLYDVKLYYPMVSLNINFNNNLEYIGRTFPFTANS